MSLTKQQKVPNGIKLSLDESVMPEGSGPYYGVYEGDSPNVRMLNSWCANVRGEWNARKASKEAAEAQQAAAHRAAKEQQPSPADGRSGGSVPVEDDFEVGETSLEQSLRAKVIELDSSCDRWKNRADSLRDQHADALFQLKRITKERDLAERMVKMYLEAYGNSPTDSSPDSVELLPKTE